MENIITLPVPEIKTALTGLGKVIGRSSLPVLKTVRIRREPAGAVSLQGTDLDSFVSYASATNQPGPACEFLAPYEALAKAVKGLSSKESLALVQEDETVKLRTFIGTSPVEQKLETIPPAEWPPVPALRGSTHRVNGEFHHTLRQAFECASEDPSRSILQGACLDTRDAKAHYLAASNGRVAFAANSFNFPFKESVVIPNTRFLNWAALGEEEGLLLVQPPEKKGSKNQETQPGWLSYQLGPWTYLAKTIEGEYPNWRQVIPVESKATVRLREEALKLVLEILPRLPGDDTTTHTVVLLTQGGNFLLEARPRDGKEKVHVPIASAEVTGQEVRVALNRHNLALALKFGLGEIHLVDEVTPVVCLSATKKLVIAPVRMEEPVTVVPQAQAQTNPTASVSSGDETNPNPPPATPVSPTSEPTMTKTNETTQVPEAKPENSLRAVIEQVDGIKASLGGVIRELAAVTGLLRQVEKDKEASDKEIEAVRAKLREIQAVKI